MDSKEPSYQQFREKNLIDKKEFLKQLNISSGVRELGSSISKTPVQLRKRKASSSACSESDPDLNPSSQEIDEEAASNRLIQKVTRDWGIYYPITRSKSDFETWTKSELNSDKDDFIDESEGTICPPPTERKWSSKQDGVKMPKRVILSPDEITEKDLANVAESHGAKVRCKIRGTTCHQCRQKTLDTKSICRSPDCRGIRGAFCGMCLRNRYGEEVKAVLKDPDWSCPPCRGFCSCSICRAKAGLRCTGILKPTAEKEGFRSVKDYLESKIKKAGQKMYE